MPVEEMQEVVEQAIREGYLMQSAALPPNQTVYCVTRMKPPEETPDSINKVLGFMIGTYGDSQTPRAYLAPSLPEVKPKKSRFSSWRVCEKNAFSPLYV